MADFVWGLCPTFIGERPVKKPGEYMDSRDDLGELWRYFRIHIGHGLHLQHLSDGRVVLQSLSKIFVQSGYLDFCDGCPYGSKVHRFTQESPPTTVRNGMSFHREKNDRDLQLFDLRWAYKEMLSRTRSTSEALRAQAAAVAGYSQGAQVR